jgi:hypothetical protein
MTEVEVKSRRRLPLAYLPIIRRPGSEFTVISPVLKISVIMPMRPESAPADCWDDGRGLGGAKREPMEQRSVLGP